MDSVWPVHMPKVIARDKQFVLSGYAIARGRLPDDFRIIIHRSGSCTIIDHQKNQAVGAFTLCVAMVYRDKGLDSWL